MSTNLLEPGGSWLYVAETDPSTLTNRMWALDKAPACVRFVRGMRMTKVQDLLHEWSAALQFPYYFGDNWGAFDECLVELEWLHAEAYVIVVLGTGHALPGDDDFKALLETLQTAADEWAEDNEFRPARPFKVVLQEDPGLRAGKLRERLERLGYRPEPFTL